MRKQEIIRLAFIRSLPVMAGYIVLGTGFGVLLRGAGYGVLWSFAMSLLIYAGSMQYVGVSLLAGGASLLTAALTTFMVNARHLFYSISMIGRYRDAGKYKPYLIFGKRTSRSFQRYFTSSIKRSSVPYKLVLSLSMAARSRHSMPRIEISLPINWTIESAGWMPIVPSI